MKIPKTIDIPIDFCPKCNNEKIRVVLGRSFEEEFSLSGKCLKKAVFPRYYLYYIKMHKMWLAK